MKPEYIKPGEIEKRSFALIAQELGDRQLDPEQESVIKRVIHTTADFDYADTLHFTAHAVGRMQRAIREGACIVTDTQMAKAGINKKELTDTAERCFVSWGMRMWRRKPQKGGSRGLR